MTVDPQLAALQISVEQAEGQRALAHERRAERVRALKAEGHSLQRLAGQLGISKQRVSAILKSPPRTIQAGSGRVPVDSDIAGILLAGAQPRNPPGHSAGAETQATPLTAVADQLREALSLLAEASTPGLTENAVAATLRDASHTARRAASIAADLSIAAEAKG